MENIKSFLEELEELSVKHGLWLEKNDQKGTIDIVDKQVKVIAEDLHFNGNIQLYTVSEPKSL